jgi:hypothetical protein
MKHLLVIAFKQRSTINTHRASFAKAKTRPQVQTSTVKPTHPFAEYRRFASRPRQSPSDEYAKPH